jgi:hypothetical protein
LSSASLLPKRRSRRESSRSRGEDSAARTRGRRQFRTPWISPSYDERFDELVAEANAWRRVLYGWSVLLEIPGGAAWLQLRRLYAGLERRVRERTAALAKALDALWGEMRLARKIQEALVPAAPRLPRCDVAASIKPAEDVGGDYYDVVQAGGR